MRGSNRPLLSVVVPVYNEAAHLKQFNQSLSLELKKSTKNNYELIYCNDGSTDKTAELIKQFRQKNPKIRLISLSRNFGKEIATTSGLHMAKGRATMMIDADGQHPIGLIPEFLKSWQAGHKVVVGLRRSNRGEGLLKKYGSKLFYMLIRRLTKQGIIEGATDYRLIDNSVQAEFIRMTERSRITRGLIDWLGYQPEYIIFDAKPRLSGDAGYSIRKLFKLAVDSTISMSLSPLYISAYIGAVVLPLSTLMGLVMVVDALFGDPLNFNATGSAYVVVLILFLIGILLVSQGIIGLYLSHIHTETQNRPLYIVDKDNSVGIDGN